MKKMRLMSFAVAAVLCAGFVSCGDDEPDEPQNPATENTGGASGDGDSNGNGNNGSGSNGDNAGGNNGGDNNGGNTGGTIGLVGAVADAVDLGLPNGTLWASWNVGATAPEEYGGYYAWGEIEEKNFYDWSTYKWSNGSETTLTKYCTTGDYGTVDNKTVLEPEDDVANMMWGNGWRMPTTEEQQELADNCTWTWTTLNGVRGYKVTSKSNGNSIFMPAAGCRCGTSLNDAGSYGDYWIRTLFSYSSYSYGCFRAYDLSFNSDRHGVGHASREDGRSVRPVKGK